MEQSIFEDNSSSPVTYAMQPYAAQCGCNARRSRSLADWANIMQIVAAIVGIIAFLYSMFKRK